MRPTEHAQIDARRLLVDRLLTNAVVDERVLAVLDYGSSSEGREDAWSDIDLALSIRPVCWDDFSIGWRDWLARSGEVLLGFEAGFGHPWAVMATAAAPVRVDLHLYGEPTGVPIETALTNWPNAPTSVESMLLFDRDASMSNDVGQLVGRSLAPDNEVETFSSVASNFWYYAHRTWCKLQRGSDWDVRWNITTILTGNICALLRLESGGTERWIAADAASGIEAAISDKRLQSLNSCIPGNGPDALGSSFSAIIALGADVCETISRRDDVSWPDELALILKRLTT
jgi:hypothetical protein